MIALVKVHQHGPSAGLQMSVIGSGIGFLCRLTLCNIFPSKLDFPYPLCFKTFFLLLFLFQLISGFHWQLGDNPLGE